MSVYLSEGRSRSTINVKRNIIDFLPQPPDVRLRSGAMVSEGRVEVKYHDFWGTICDDHWTLKEANVVCRSLGYGSAAMAATNAYYGRGMGRVMYDFLCCFILFCFSGHGVHGGCSFGLLLAPDGKRFHRK